MWSIVGNRNLRTLIEERAHMSPAKTFLVFEGLQGDVESFAYRHFDENVNRLANALITMGIKKADKVNLHLRNCPEFLFGWFALAKIGAVMVPTNPLSTAPELQYILAHSESVACVTEPEYLDVVRATLPHCPNVKRVILCRAGVPQTGTTSMADILQGDPSPPPDAGLAPDDEVAILYTSGTTAQPKGVILTHAYYIWTGELAAHHEKLRPADRHFIVLPLFHGNAQFYSTMASLVTGASISLMQTFSASRYFEQAARHGATVASLFAAPMRMILKQPSGREPKKNRLRLVLFAQNLTPEQLAEFERLAGASLAQLYGLTELSFPMCNPIDGRSNNMSIGRPTLGVEVKVVDDGGREAPVGATGELIIKGIPGWTLMKGYFKNPQATAEAIRDNWFYTGDNVRLGEDGFFYFVDRKKDMIKRAGENVPAAEVEAVVNEHPKVLESAAIGVPDEMRDEAIKVFVVLKGGERATEEELIEHCRQHLMKLKVPSFIEFVADLPKTSVGKIQKHILKRAELEKISHAR
jgi:crotonobetaine/carnitine-CoA ligase